jgi:hypothetical protein
MAFSVSKTLDADRETWDIVGEEEAEKYTRLLAEERRKGKKSEQNIILSATPTGGFLKLRILLISSLLSLQISY